MQKVTLTLRCQPGRGEVLLDKLSALQVETRAYEGCHSVQTYVDADDIDTVVIMEDWETRGHHEQYMGWRVDTGLPEILQPILASPLEIHYLKEHSA